jgi:hypothetical protein
LREHYGDGAVYETRRVIPELAAYFNLTPQDLAESDGSHPRFWHKVHSALSRHRRFELLVRPERGSFRYVPENLAGYEPNHHPAQEAKGEEGWITHSFHLRPDLTLEFELPVDLTPQDAQRIARFVETLPFGRESRGKQGTV